MGRRRVQNLDLPKRMYTHHGGYRYEYSENGKTRKFNLGRNREEAIKLADGLNAIHKTHRRKLLRKVRRVNREIKEEIIRRDELRCVYCGSESNLVVDHFIPRASGGATDTRNLVTACAECNDSKNDRHPVVFAAGFADINRQVLLKMLDLFPCDDKVPPVTNETENRGVRR